MESQKETFIVKGDDFTEITFVNVKTNDEVIFNDEKPILSLSDILQPIVKIENCVWLKEE